MRIICTLLVLCLAFLPSVQAQTILNPEWTRQVFSLEDGSAAAWDLDVDADGMIYWPVNVDSLNNGVDIYCYKYDEAGEAQWTTPSHFLDSGGQFAFSVHAKTNDLYVGGRECLISGFSCDMQLLKIEKETGRIIWDRLQDFGNNGYDEIDGLVVREDGIYCGGWAQVIQQGAYQTEMGLWKLDTDGNTEWVNHFGQAGTAEHQDGHFVVDDNHIFAAGLYGGSGLFNTFNGYSFIGKFSKTDGSLVDTTLFGPQSDALLDIENALGMTSDGTHFYLTGYSTPVSGDPWQTFVAKFDADLNLIWLKDWGGTDSESARGITVHEGKIYVAGLTASPEYSAGGAADALLLILDTDGNYLSHHTWGDELENSFRDVAIHNDAIYLSGFSGTDFTQAGSISGNLLKVQLDDLTSTDFNETPSPLPLKVFPNPTNGHFTVELPAEYSDQGEVVIVNALGKEVLRRGLQAQQNNFQLDAPGGVYFYSFRQAGQLIGSGRLVVR